MLPITGNMGNLVKAAMNMPGQAFAPLAAGLCGLQALMMLLACPASTPLGATKAVWGG